MTLMTDTLKLVARDNDTMGSLGCMESTGSGFSSAHSAWAARHSAWLDQPRAHDLCVFKAQVQFPQPQRESLGNPDHALFPNLVCADIQA